MGTTRNNGSADAISQQEAAEAVTDLTAAGEPTLTVVTTVAELTGTRPAELPPLGDAIDPDALNSLFTSQRGAVTMDGEITFEYLDCAVTITSDGTVSVQQ